MTHWMMPRILLEENQSTALRHLDNYFNPKTQEFAGRVFETLAGRGDSAKNSDEIMPADLLALATLSVPVSGTAVEQFLEGELGREVGSLLAGIPREADITSDVGRRLLREENSQLAELWKAIRGASGFGPVRTSKLLARKRPHLVPIFDQSVRDTFHVTGSQDHWAQMVRFFEDDVLIRRLEELRADSPHAGESSLLRIFDVAVWMEWKYRQLGSTRIE